MNFLHYRMNAGPGALIEVKISGNASVRLLDSLNYYKYKAGKAYLSASEFRDTSFAQVWPPYKGEWHIVIDLDGKKGEIRATVDVLRTK